MKEDEANGSQRLYPGKNYMAKRRTKQVFPKKELDQRGFEQDTECCLFLEKQLNSKSVSAALDLSHSCISVASENENFLDGLYPSSIHPAPNVLREIRDTVNRIPNVLE
jgi:hypothetical protein